MLKPESCKPCPLYNISYGFSEPEGEGTCGVDIVGEALGYHEYIDGKAFRPHAQAGSKLEEAFKLVALQTQRPCTRSMFRLGNVVWCRPPGDHLAGASYEQEAINSCRHNLFKFLNNTANSGNNLIAIQDNSNIRNKRVILALGNISLREIAGVSGIYDEKQSISHLRGYVLEGPYGKVIGSIHPAAIKRGNNHWTPLLVADIVKSLEVASGRYAAYPSHPSYRKPAYQLAPSPDDGWAFYYRAKDSSKLVLAYDIETEDSAATDEHEREELSSKEITLFQFSLAKDEGIAFPWTPEYIPIIRALMLLPLVKIGHNVYHFDNPIIRAKGVEINGRILDTMWMFKHWQPRLPRGLQNVASLLSFPFPWKHLFSSNLPYYGCADVDSLQYIIHALPKLMRSMGVWGGYMRHVVQLNTVFDKASQRGIPVSTNKWTEVNDWFKVERDKVNKELQAEIPDELRNVKPRRVDKETGQVDEGYVSEEPAIYKRGIDEYANAVRAAEQKGLKTVDLPTYLERKYNLVRAEFKIPDTGESVERWCILEPFKASSTQLIKYLQYKQSQLKEEIDKLRVLRKDQQGSTKELTQKINELKDLMDDYEVPLHLKTKRPTTNADDLEEIFHKTGDLVIEKTIKIRSLDTNINNFMKNWYPGLVIKKKGQPTKYYPNGSGVVHPTYGYTAPSGQINSWGPNSQNVSKHTEYGKRMRGIIEAPPGYCFVEGDKRSFHIATMGYCANDRDYIRFSRIDPHSIFGSYIAPDIIGCRISLKWSDDEIRQATKEFKKKCKEIEEKDPLHGINVRQQLAKPTILGNQLELGARKLQRQNQRYIHSVAEAEALQDMLHGLFALPEVCKSRIKDQAFKQKYLTNEFGRIDFFYDIFSFTYDKKTRKWRRKDGEGAREPIAWSVQSRAFGMIDEELLTLDEMGICEEHNFMVTIHDSLVFMPEIGKKDKCIESLVDVMNRPCKYLVNEATGPDGLQVGVDVSVGNNWRDMSEIKI